ncbi:MAG: ferredoxin [Gemmatimonadales bacterium]
MSGGTGIEERIVHGLRVQIDRSVCVGFADCIHTAPAAFRLDDEGLVIFEYPEECNQEELLRACDACPVDAITVWDAEGGQLVP